MPSGHTMEQLLRLSRRSPAAPPRPDRSSSTSAVQLRLRPASWLPGAACGRHTSGSGGGRKCAGTWCSCCSRLRAEASSGGSSWHTLSARCASRGRLASSMSAAAVDVSCWMSRRASDAMQADATSPAASARCSTVAQRGMPQMEASAISICSTREGRPAQSASSLRR